MKSIIITGANGNLGSAVTMKFLDLGFRVIAPVINQAAVAELGNHEHLETEVLDLTNEEQVTVFVHRVIEKYKRVEAAIMLVGGFAAGDIRATSNADLDKQITLNFKTAYFITRPLFEHMMLNGVGRLIFTGARPALQAADGKNLLAYALGKSLLFKLSEFLNEEAKGTNVTSTVIVPSTIDTEPNRKFMPDADPAKWVSRNQLADVLAFVVSEEGSALRENVLKVYNNA